MVILYGTPTLRGLPPTTLRPSGRPPVTIHDLGFETPPARVKSTFPVRPRMELTSQAVPSGPLVGVAFVIEKFTGLGVVVVLPPPVVVVMTVPDAPASECNPPNAPREKIERNKLPAPVSVTYSTWLVIRTTGVRCKSMTSRVTGPCSQR